jgi:tetratricopeptide (TPR) repeat protein
MSRRILTSLLMLFLLSVWGAKVIVAADPIQPTTAGSIAIANLDQQIAQAQDESGVEDLLLLRSQFLADYEALDRAGVLAEGRLETSRDLLRRARTRAARHQFADALADLASAESKGAIAEQTAQARASILIATGHADQVVSRLEVNLIRHPGFASRSQLAAAFAALGHVDDADRLYAAAVHDLRTTLPFPYAWIYFARGLMWEEVGHDRGRAEEMYKRALAYVPEFVAANIDLAELEMMRGDRPDAEDRLLKVIRIANEPEAHALLGTLYFQQGEQAKGEKESLLARQRFESLLDSNLLAFADHAAEFYLGAGHDPERAWNLAKINLANRETNRSVALAIKAAEESGRYADACELLRNHGSAVEQYLRNLEQTLGNTKTVRLPVARPRSE